MVTQKVATSPYPVRRWGLGEITVTQVTEEPIELGLLDGLIPDATFEAVKGITWLYPDYANDEGQLLWNIHTYVLEVGDSVIIVDTGVGNGKAVPVQPLWSDWNTEFLERLTAAGFPPESVDLVLCTHLHVDHVGWNTTFVEGAWRPTFPNAVHAFVRAEYEYYSGVARSQAYPGESEIDALLREQARFLMEQSIRPLEEAGVVRLVDSGEEVAPGISYVPTPGHTPAHHSVSVRSGDEAAFITGDFIHHPVQIARPAWSSAPDYDGSASARNRQEFLESCAETGTRVFGTHFTGSSVGTITRDGDGFRFVSLSNEKETTA
jgi:glyoxylase-like metal-dependent hydrolase (beta-lactamase superfamily II)